MDNLPTSHSAEANRRRRNSQTGNLALAAGIFALLVIVTIAMRSAVPHLPMPVANIPPASDDYYLAFAGAVALDHRVLFHGECDTLPHLKAADVLLLGNSRVMFGFPQDPFKKLFQQFHMSYYMLGFGHTESDRFPLELIRKFDLHPKLVIVNADYFFIGGQSLFSEKIMRESRFEARKQLFEGDSTYRVRSHLHRYLPHWMYVLEEREELVVHRSRSDGSWLQCGSEPERFPVSNGPGQFAPPTQLQSLEHARQFKAAMDQRGARVILTFLPSDYGNREHAVEIARFLNVPLISPQLQGLETFDHSHLTPACATRFTTAFIEDLKGVLQPASLSSPAGLFSPAAGSGSELSQLPDVAQSERGTAVKK